MTISANMRLNFSGQIEGGSVFGGPYFYGEFALIKAFTDGVGADQFDLAYFTQRTVASGANDDLDLYGTLIGIMGNTINADELVGIMIVNRRIDPNDAANTTNLNIGGGSNVQTLNWLGGVNTVIQSISPGGIFMMMNPTTAGMGGVASGVGDIIRVTNSAGASNTYTVALLLRSA